MEYNLKALHIREQNLPSNHPHLAISYSNMACSCREWGDHEGALAYELKALELREAMLHPDDLVRVNSYHNVGVAYAYVGEYELALEFLEKALEIREKKLPAGHPDTEMTRENIAAVKEEIAANEHP